MYPNIGGMQDDKGFLTRQDDLPQESCRISREINAAWWKKTCQTAFCRCSDIPKGAFKKETVPVPQRHKDGVAISRLAALGRTYESLPSPAVFGTHLILYSRDQQKSTLKYTFSVKSLPSSRTRRCQETEPGKTCGFPGSCAKGERRNFNHFRRGVCVAKIPRPVRPWGAYTSPRTGGGI